MQPYLLPNIRYFQLIYAVDTFVIADDLNFIKNSFINRNFMLLNNTAFKFTLQLKGASQNKLINEIEIGDNRGSLLKTFEVNYKKAPYFNDVFPLLEMILYNEEKNLAKFVSYSLEVISKYLELKTKFLYSSEIEKNCNLRFDDRIIDICKSLKADHYINTIGGKKLYCKNIFNHKGIKLDFINTEIIEYKQFTKEFVPDLSIIDMLMFNSIDEIITILNRYKLV